MGWVVALGRGEGREKFHCVKRLRDDGGSGVIIGELPVCSGSAFDKRAVESGK
jgi:hypothetical protein